MANISGIAIVIKAFLPTGKTLDEQFAALNTVKTAHETGDYASLLSAAAIEEVKAEQKTRREPAAKAPKPDDKQTDIEGAIAEKAKTDAGQRTADEPGDANVPAFLKEGKKAKAA